MAKVGKDGAFTLSKVGGSVVRARGLLNSKLIGKSLPRCYVKGIKSNSHLVTLFCTEVSVGQNPTWDAEWSFDCLKDRSRDEFVGLKFMVYDGEEFLGGADLDVCEMSAHIERHEEVELAGVVYAKAAGFVPKKARLFVTIRVEREFLPRFEAPQKMLLDHMHTVTRVTSICGRIVKAHGLAGKMDDSLPMLFVRCFMSSGKIVDMYHTKCSDDVKHPKWEEVFEFEFDEEDEFDKPLMLMFDIFGSTGKSPDNYKDIFSAGDHLGSAMVSVSNIKDVAAFEAGECKQKVSLRGDCQLIEKRLGEDGEVVRKGRQVHVRGQSEARSALQSGDVSTGSGAKESWWARGTDKLKQIRSRASKKKEEAANLRFELFAEKMEVVMPHSQLLNDSIIVEEGDLEQGDVDEEMKAYFGSTRNDGERVKSLNITAEERIAVVYGRLNAATDLIGGDLNGKSDPYVVVEALTKFGELHFVYRSRVVWQNLNPVYDEAFFWTVPADPENPAIPVALSKLQFSIIDCDDGQVAEQMFTGEDEDDYLGKASVDVSYMRNCDNFSEAVPLLGVKARPGGFKSSGTFRRYSTISVDVRVERRAMRIVEPRHDHDPALLDVHRHHDSRPMHPPEFKGYRDLSQIEAAYDPGAFDAMAVTVLNLKEDNQLLEQALRREASGQNKQQDGVGWMARREWPPFVERVPPPPRPLSAEKELDLDDLDERAEAPVNCRRDWPALKENWDEKLHLAQADLRNLDYINRMPPLGRTASLPMLATRFGGNYNKNILVGATFKDRNHRKDAKYAPPYFRPDSSQADAAMKFIGTKTTPRQYSERRPSSAADVRRMV